MRWWQVLQAGQARCGEPATPLTHGVDVHAQARGDRGAGGAGFVYVDGVRTDGEVLRLRRLRYAGSASQWGFAIYRASHDDHEDSYLPTAIMGGTAEDALHTACGLYLADATAWI
jgi:hypothetical protein